jgi:hypothetical protein
MQTKGFRMTAVHTKRELGDINRGDSFTALGLAAILGLGIILTAGGQQPSQPALAAAAPAALEPSRFILNALLVPALDSDAVPLRWVDPRPAMRCGPETAVRANHEPLLAGTLVPDLPFEVEWQTDGCRPFGARGPRFDGKVKLTVYREDWGFSAARDRKQGITRRKIMHEKEILCTRNRSRQPAHSNLMTLCRSATVLARESAA